MVEVIIYAHFRFNCWVSSSYDISHDVQITWYVVHFLLRFNLHIWLNEHLRLKWAHHPSLLTILFWFSLLKYVANRISAAAIAKQPRRRSVGWWIRTWFQPIIAQQSWFLMNTRPPICHHWAWKCVQLRELSFWRCWDATDLLFSAHANYWVIQKPFQLWKSIYGIRNSIWK